MFVNRIATVISTPLEVKTPIEKGDDIIVHHNVFRRWFDIRGAEKNSTSFLSEDTYFVTEDQVFAYKRDEEWKGLPDFCFVKPVENKDEWGLKDDANLMVIPNLVDTEFFSLPAPRVQEPFVILSIGRLEVEKGMDLLLEAFDLFAEDHPEA